jgi:G3E family GTPase
LKDFGSIDTLMDRQATDMEGDYRTIVNLLTDQVEFANVIVLNKTDMMTAEEVGTLKSVMKKLNANAKIVESSFGKVDLNNILNTNLFDFEETSQSAGWIEELNKEHHTPETEEYGISSFVYRSRRPFHPERFWNYLNYRWNPGIIRSKGLFWLASRKDDALNWSQAGGSLRAERAGVWWSSMSYKERISYVSFIENKEEIEAKWDQRFGDRQNELVIIGQGIDADLITRQLDTCLCTEEEIEKMNSGANFKDDFPC